MFHRGSRKRKVRSGSALAAVLVCVLVAMMLGAALTKTLLVQHRQLHLAQQQQQSFWLAESAIQRTLDKLKETPDYRGETWRVPASDLDLASSGVVVVQVEPVDDPQAGWSVRVESRFPDDPKHCAVLEKELVLLKTTPEPAETDPAKPDPAKPDPAKPDPAKPPAKPETVTEGAIEANSDSAPSRSGVD